MAPTASEIFDVIAPELVGIQSKSVFLELAEGQTSKKMCSRPMAVALLAAHMASIASRGEGVGGAVGAVGGAQSVTEDRLSVSFATGTSIGVSGPLSSTRFGIELERLHQSCIITPRTVMVR